MRITNCLLALPVALLLSNPGLEAKDEGKAKNKQTADKNNKNKQKTSVNDWKRSTEGHRPQDLDGDGIITRDEWPGNDVSFREVDKDGDGVLTNRDRGYGAQGGEKRMYERPVNDYGKKKPKRK